MEVNHSEVDNQTTNPARNIVPTTDKAAKSASARKTHVDRNAGMARKPSISSKLTNKVKKERACNSPASKDAVVLDSPSPKTNQTKSKTKPKSGFAVKPEKPLAGKKKPAPILKNSLPTPFVQAGFLPPVDFSDDEEELPSTPNVAFTEEVADFLLSEHELNPTRGFDGELVAAPIILLVSPPVVVKAPPTFIKLELGGLLDDDDAPREELNDAATADLVINLGQAVDTVISPPILADAIPAPADPVDTALARVFLPPTDPMDLAPPLDLPPTLPETPPIALPVVAPFVSNTPIPTPRASKKAVPEETRVCRFNDKKGGCSKPDCPFRHPQGKDSSATVPSGKSKRDLVAAAIANDAQKELGNQDAQKALAAAAKQIKDDDAELAAAIAKQELMVDDQFYTGRNKNPDSFLHFIKGPAGLTNPMAVLLFSVFLIFWELFLRVMTEKVITYIISLCGSYVLQHIPFVTNSSTFDDGLRLVGDLGGVVHVVNVGVWFIYRVVCFGWIMVANYDLERLYRLTYIGNMHWELLSRFMGVCEKNCFVMYTPCALHTKDNSRDRRLVAGRDPDRRLPSLLRYWQVSRGTLAWPVDKRPSLGESIPWLRGNNRGAPRRRNTPNVLGDNLQMSWNNVGGAETTWVPFLDMFVYINQSRSVLCCDTYLANMCSPRNINRAFDYDVAKANLVREASSIKHINLDQDSVLSLHNVVSDTQMIAFGFLTFDRQSSITADLSREDFCLAPRA